MKTGKNDLTYILYEAAIEQLSNRTKSRVHNTNCKFAIFHNV